MITNNYTCEENFNNNSRVFTIDRLLNKIEIRIIFGIIMVSLCLVTTIGNLIVIYKYKRSYSVGNLFIVSLAVADLIVGAFVMPIASIYAVTDQWLLSLPVCQIWLSADYTASTASILNLFTLSLDRYWSITSPLKYLSKRTKSRALLMIGIVWTISILWIIPITAWPYIANNGIRIVPDYECDTEYRLNLAFKLITAIFNFYVPLIAMIIINTKIYLVIRKRYRNPIMQYTSGPNSKYLWEQQKSDGSCSTGSNTNNNNNNDETATSGMKVAINSLFRLSATIALTNTEKNEISKFANNNSTFLDFDYGKDRKSSYITNKMFINWSNKKLSILSFRKTKSKEKENKSYSKTKSCCYERFKPLNYDNRNPSPIYTPIKRNNNNNDNNDVNLNQNIEKNNSTNNVIEIVYTDLSPKLKYENSYSFDKELEERRTIETKKINYEMETFLYENAKIDQFYDDLMNENKIISKNNNSSIKSKGRNNSGRNSSRKSSKKKAENSTNANTNNVKCDEFFIINANEIDSSNYENNNNTTNSGDNTKSAINLSREKSIKSNNEIDFIKNDDDNNNNKNTSKDNCKLITDQEILNISKANDHSLTNSNGICNDKIKKKVSPQINGETNNNKIRKLKNLNDISSIAAIANTPTAKPTQAFYNQQEKAFRQLAAIVIGFTLCFLPYFVLFLIIALCENCVNEYLFKLTIWLGYLNSMLNPFLYALSNRKFRRKGNSNAKTDLNSNNYKSKTMSYQSNIKTDTTVTVNNRTNVPHYK